MQNEAIQNAAVTHAASRRHVPKEGDYIIVDLPGERTRATVVEMLNEDTMVVELTSIVMGKSHVYRTGHVIPVQRAKSDLDRADKWEVIDEQEMRNREHVAAVAERAIKEKEDAAGAGQQPHQPHRDLKQHQGIASEPVPGEAEHRDSAVKRKKASA